MPRLQTLAVLQTLAALKRPRPLCAREQFIVSLALRESERPDLEEPTRLPPAALAQWLAAKKGARLYRVMERSMRAAAGAPGVVASPLHALAQPVGELVALRLAVAPAGGAASAEARQVQRRIDDRMDAILRDNLAEALAGIETRMPPLLGPGATYREHVSSTLAVSAEWRRLEIASTDLNLQLARLIEAVEEAALKAAGQQGKTLARRYLAAIAQHGEAAAENRAACFKVRMDLFAEQARAYFAEMPGWQVHPDGFLAYGMVLAAVQADRAPEQWA